MNCTLNTSDIIFGFGPIMATCKRPLEDLELLGQLTSFHLTQGLANDFASVFVPPAFDLSIDVAA
ncbi:MAG: hypothetical protein L0Y58_05170 [Verrucomicrobia subdivision 3 bacterium]|nr:hypothetical protein [Limisphaerales bacterium]